MMSNNDLKEQYQSEAKFIRALMYFNLVQFFGDVPLVLHEIKTEKEAYSFSRVSVEKVYEQIEKDSKEAAQSLPFSYSDDTRIGKATKGAALSLLGKVYVTNKKYEEAFPVFKEVINSNNYRLLTDYKSVFNIGNENNDEIIFVVQYLGGTGHGEGSNFSITFAPHGSGTEVTSGGTPGGGNAGTYDLYQSFEGGDLRKSVAMQTRFSEGDTVYYTQKFLDKPPAAGEGDNDWPVLRYPDVLLLYAEALNETGSTNEARAYISRVRNRAGLASLDNIDQISLREAIQHERRVELCFEGHRWFDLLRTDTMISTMQTYKEKYAGTDHGHRVADYDVTPSSFSDSF